MQFCRKRVYRSQVQCDELLPLQVNAINSRAVPKDSRASAKSMLMPTHLLPGASVLGLSSFAAHWGCFGNELDSGQLDDKTCNLHLEHTFPFDANHKDCRHRLRSSCTNPRSALRLGRRHSMKLPHRHRHAKPMSPVAMKIPHLCLATAQWSPPTDKTRNHPHRAEAHHGAVLVPLVLWTRASAPPRMSSHRNR